MKLAIPFTLVAALVAAGVAAGQPAPASPAPPESAAATGWKLSTTVGLNLSQSSFTTNWAGGDRGSIVWVLNSNTGAERQFGARFHLSNQLQLAYGQTAQQQQRANSTERFWQSPSKTTDQIVFGSVGRFTLGGWVDPYVGLRLDSQFRDESYLPLAVLPFNPVKLKESAGIARVLSKTAESEATTRLGFGLRQTFARSINAVTLARDRFTTNDGGLEWETQVTQPIMAKRILYKGDLLVFQALFYSQADHLKTFDALVRAGDATVPANPGAEAVQDFWRAPDVNFQNTFSAQITKSISVNLLAQWIYDKFDNAADVNPGKSLNVLIPEVRKNVRKAGQFKETLALGFSYRLF
jgi:hypothetical protein